MSAKQPTRKPTGKRKESDASALEGRERKRAAKRKGLKAGSRQQVEQGNKGGSGKRGITLIQAEHLLRPQRPFSAFFGQAQATGLALEQRITQMTFQPGNLPAHRPLGDVQLLGGSGEVTALGRDPKGVQGGQRR